MASLYLISLEISFLISSTAPVPFWLFPPNRFGKVHVGTTEHAAAHVGADNVSSAKVVEVDGAATKAPVGALVPLESLHKLQKRRSIAREGHFELLNAVGDHHHDPHDGSRPPPAY